MIIAPFVGQAAAFRPGAPPIVLPMAAVATMAVSEEVEGDEGDADQHPDPVLEKPVHGRNP